MTAVIFMLSSHHKAAAEKRQYKILHIMSYHSPWRWTDGLFNGFKEELKKLDVEYKVFQMDTKRYSKEKEGQLRGVEFISWDIILTFSEFKHKISEYHSKADAIALIGIFNFKDEKGKNVPYPEALKWTAENSRLPDFSFWIDRVNFGTLCTVNVSEREKGIAAGKIAYGIIAEGKKPSEFQIKPTVKGIPVVNIARAQKLGINIKSGILLSSEVIKNFEWDKR